MYKHKKIAITGGPCAGKTTAMQKIVKEFTEKGYEVFVVSETATDLILGGIKPFGDNACDMVEFQRYVLWLQMEKEKLFEKYANELQKDTIILCDRGIMDNRAYVDGETFKELLAEKGLSEIDAMASYDLILHLVTAAIGAKEFYTTENNSARTETIEEAIEKDHKTLDSWIGHKKIRIIGNDVNFNQKINQVIKNIYEEMGEPYPIQNQRKFLISNIDFDKISNNRLVKLELEQFFIFDDDKEIVYRKTSKDGHSTYIKTVKKDTENGHQRIVTSKKIKDVEYEEMKKYSAPKLIKKNRYCFTYNNQYFRLDVFNEPNGLMVLETELTNENEKFSIPNFIELDREITDDIEFRNSSIYKKINSSEKMKKLVNKKDT